MSVLQAKAATEAPKKEAYLKTETTLMLQQSPVLQMKDVFPNMAVDGNELEETLPYIEVMGNEHRTLHT